MDFDFEYTGPEIVEEPPKEKSTYAAFAPAPEMEVPEDQVFDDIKLTLIDLGEKCWVDLVTIAQDDDIKEKYQDTLYSEAWVGEVRTLVPDIEFFGILVGRFVRALFKAARSIVGSIVFTNDDGKAYTSMQGYGEIDDGYWKVDVVKEDKLVVPVSSLHCVDLQLFCASVAIDIKRKAVIIEKRRQFVNVPAIIQKNLVPDKTISADIKSLVLPLLCLPARPTKAQIETAPFVWRKVYEACKDINIPLVGIPLPLAYFSFCKKTFGYKPGPIELNRLFYEPYDSMIKDLGYHAAVHSVFVGGYFLKPFHYLNEGVRHLTHKTIGGKVPVKWCSFNTHHDVVWERSGAFSEGLALGTEIVAVREVQDFDGIWYDPTNISPHLLAQATGVIVPYDKNGKGLNWAKQWLSKKGEYGFLKMYTTLGPSCCLWLEVCEQYDGGQRFCMASMETLWRSMPVLNFYNLAASLNANCIRAKAAGDATVLQTSKEQCERNKIPFLPVAVVHSMGGISIDYKRLKGNTLKVPALRVDFFPWDYLPGRHVIDEKVEEVDTITDSFDEFNDFRADAVKGMKSTAPRPKRKKTEDDAAADDDE